MSERDIRDSWATWHAARMRVVTEPHGIAALVATHWLSPDPQTLEGLEGSWWLDGAAIVGDEFTIVEGGEVIVGSLLLRHFRRDDQIALRVFDPDASTRASVADIDAYMPDEAWILEGHFAAAPDGAAVDLTEIDGYVENTALAGTVSFEIDGRPVELLATGSRTQLEVVFQDATSGSDTYRFRFLKLRADKGDGPLEIDFNRAYLPPCAFADFYVCPLPPTQNRLPMPIPAGEKTVVERTP